MRVPKDLNPDDLIAKLEVLGYKFVRQRSSHMTLQTEMHGSNVLRIPDHNPLAPGTLRKILQAAARHAALSDDELIRLLKL